MIDSGLAAAGHALAGTFKEQFSFIDKRCDKLVGDLATLLGGDLLRSTPAVASAAPPALVVGERSPARLGPEMPLRVFAEAARFTRSRFPHLSAPDPPMLMICDAVPPDLLDVRRLVCEQLAESERCDAAHFCGGGPPCWELNGDDSGSDRVDGDFNSPSTPPSEVAAWRSLGWAP